MEHKTFPALVLKADGDQGVVEHIVAVMGNIDLGNDRIEPGAFVKTLAERGSSIKVLDQHNTDSIMRVLGKPLAMRELTKSELPADLLSRYPEAKGGLWARTQFLLDTPEGKGAFQRIKAGAVEEFSIGYDALNAGFENVVVNGKQTAIRSIKQIKLYEYSPVLFAMNPATRVLSAKSAEEEVEATVPKAEPVPTADTPDVPLDLSVKAVWEARWEEAKQGQRLNRAYRQAMRQIQKMLTDMLQGYEDEVADEQAARCDPDDEDMPHKPTKEVSIEIPPAEVQAEADSTADEKAGPGTTPPTSPSATDEPQTEEAGPDVTPPTSSAGASDAVEAKASEPAADPFAELDAAERRVAAILTRIAGGNDDHGSSSP